MPKRIPADYRFPKNLPPAAQAAFAKVDLDTRDNGRAIDAAFAAVSYPLESIAPRADMLTPQQRAVAEVITDLDLHTQNNDIDQQMPRSQAFRRRWLGLDPAGPLQKEVTFEIEDEKHKEPLWRAALMLEDSGDGAETLAEKMSLTERLTLWGELMLSWPEDFGMEAEWFFTNSGHAELLKLGSSAGEWAKAFADTFLAVTDKKPESTPWPLFLALVRAKVPIEPRWDVLLPLNSYGAMDKLFLECVKAIPAERRAEAILGRTKNNRGFASTVVWAIINVLRTVPDPRLLQLALGRLKELEGVGPRRALIALTTASGKNPQLLATIDAFKKGRPAPLQLFVKEIRQPRAGFSELDKKQLLVAGQAAFGRKVPIEALLANDKHSEETLLHLLEYRSIVDAAGKPAYDVWQYLGDTGEIFKAGTTKSVGGINQGSVEVDDARLCEALKSAVVEGRKKSSGQKPAPKPKKPAAKKPALKKPAPKKSTTSTAKQQKR